LKIAFLIFLILVSISWAKAKEYEVPLNIGIGPALFWIPGIVGRELHPAVKFDVYAVLSPKILKENWDEIPMIYKQFANKETEMRIEPIFGMFLPKYVIVSPGAKNSIYGGLWSILNITQNFLYYKNVELEGELTLPTITYLSASAEKNDPFEQSLFGIGAMLKLASTVKFSEKFLAKLTYGHIFNASLPTIGNLKSNTYREKDKSEEQRWFQAGVLSLVFNFRFINIKQKI
jgi:hypothetical protein